MISSKHANFLRSIPILAIVLAGSLGTGRGSDLDFPSGTWVHPNGTSTNGWDASQTSGTTTLPDGTTASVSVTYAGASTPTGLNLTDIDEDYFVGFAFQQDPNGALNSTALQNYMRIDIAFSKEVEIENFVLNDVDAGEIVQVEGWTGTTGAPGGGIAANYTMGNNLEAHTFDGIAGVTPKDSAGTTLDPQSNVGFDFSEPVEGMSIYYSWSGAGGFSVITIGVEGDIEISAAPVPPRIYYTYNLTNNGKGAKPVDFFDSLPAGLIWDEDYAVVTGKLTGGALVFSNGGSDVSANSMVIHKGTNTLTLRTMETSATGIIYNEASVDPKHPHLDPMIKSATITLP